MNNTFYKRLVGIGACLGVTGVLFGAFGAHFLKSRLSAYDLDIIRTSVLYLFVHVLIILIVALFARDSAYSRILRSSGIFFTTGIFLFSGSLFIIATQTLTGLKASFIGVLTPLGGLCFIAGWVMLIFYAFSRKT